jgi:proteic killer suppression protein
VIREFADRETHRLFEGAKSRAVPGDVRERAEIKLEILDAATSLEDLKIPSGNRLEALGGSRESQHSIRINRQYRLCFRFDENAGDAYDVEIVDYH